MVCDPERCHGPAANKKAANAGERSPLNQSAADPTVIRSSNQQRLKVTMAWLSAHSAVALAAEANASTGRRKFAKCGANYIADLRHGANAVHSMRTVPGGSLPMASQP
jgi:hypothetical protein